MAILKHKSSKNLNYGDVMDYYKYKHKEDTTTGFYEPLLDEFGLMQERDNYALRYINSRGQEEDPENWVGACARTNLLFRKNHSKGERKNHEYIISHPESDTPLLTKEMLLEEGIAFVRDNLKGYDALIAVHMDTDNYHLHITINSVRAADREEQPWMMKNEDGSIKPCEYKAGGKHQNSPEFRRHCQRWLYEYTKRKGLTLEDNLQIEHERKQQRFSDKHQKLRSMILNAASQCSSMLELQELLKKQYGADFVLRGKTYSLHMPGSKRGIRLDTLGLSKEKILISLQIPVETISEIQQTDNERIEKKKYIQWIHLRRRKNNIRAEDMIADAAHVVARKVQEAGRPYSKWDFRELHDLIRQTTYLQRDLQTEREKADRLLSRWRMYQAPLASPEDKEYHGSYIRWCGCDPDSIEDYHSLETECAVIDLQLQEAQSLEKALIDSADKWQDYNEENRFHYQQSWRPKTEDQLRQELKFIRANRKMLSQIAYNCQKAADRRIYNQAQLEKAQHFRQLWHNRLEQERALKQQLRNLEQSRNRGLSPSERSSKRL